MFDDDDLRILKNILVDSRTSARQLALKLGLSTVTIISRLKKLENMGIITGYTARIDHEKLGYSITAIIEVKANKGKILDVANIVAKNNDVCAVYDITGNMDTLVTAKFKTRDDLSKFVKNLNSLDEVQTTVTHLVLNTVKEDFRIL